MAKKLFSLFFAFAISSVCMQSFAQNYMQAPGSTLSFTGQYQGAAFNGNFPGFSTRLTFNPNQLANARLHVKIPLATATTGNRDYDGEMRGKAFFDSARFPEAIYTASKFRALGGNRYAADGTLSLHGVNKPVTLAFTWTPGNAPVLSGKATVRRLDFNVGGGDWADTQLIPNEINVSTKVKFNMVAKPAD